MSRGNIIGEEDAVYDRKTSTNVKCVSTDGVLYAISINDFYRRVKCDKVSWRMLKHQTLSKEISLLRKIDTKDVLYHKHENNLL